jgi:hypothetical protein
VSAQAIDFSKYEQQAPAIDFSKYENEPATPPSAVSRFTHSFLSGLGITSNEDAKNFFQHPINTAMGMVNAQGELAQKAKAAYDRGDYKSAVIHGLNYLVPFIGQQTDQAGEQLSQGDIAGGAGRTLGLTLPMLAGSPEVRTGARTAVSDVADAVGRAAQTAGRVTPKQIAQGAGGVTGAGLGHGTLSIPGAYYGVKGAGSLAEGILGKDFANKPIGLPSRVTGGPEVAPRYTPGESGSIAESAAAPTPKITPKAVEQQLNDALGGQPLKPNVSLRNQSPAIDFSKYESPAAKLPEGFTPVESSALKGFKYDPQTREFETITQGGQRYVHGDVSPEDAQAFIDAESKGKAWQQIRENPLVAKVVNGKRIAVKPASSYDLSDLVKGR